MILARYFIQFVDLAEADFVIDIRCEILGQRGEPYSLGIASEKWSCAEVMFKHWIDQHGYRWGAETFLKGTKLGALRRALRAADLPEDTLVREVLL